MKPRPATAVEIIERLEREDLVSLPTLTREEIAATGSLQASPLTDVAATEYWSGLGEDARRAATVAALRSLSARGLIDLDDGAVDPGGEVALKPSAELGVILAARRQPAFIAIGSEPRRGLFGYVRLYGIVDEERHLNIVLLERATPDAVHEFALCKPSTAASEVSRWACGPRAEGDLATGEASVRTVEVIRPSREGPRRQRLAIVVTDDSTTIGDFDEEGQLSAQRPIAEAALRERLRVMLTRAGSATAG